MEIVTPRLLLREFLPSDLDALHEMYSDPVYQKYESEPHTSLAQTSDTLRRMLEDATAQPRMRYKLAVTVRPFDAARGTISLKLNWAEIREWEIGWGMHPSEWGKGYATEAAQAMLRFAFEDMGAHRVVAFCHAGNRASSRVMEKLGMTYEGRTRQTRWLGGCWNDELIYSLLDFEFK